MAITRTGRNCFGLLGIASALLLSGCYEIASLQPDNTAWVGHDVSELKASWGDPAETETLGHQIMAYTWTSNGGVCKQTFTARDDRIVGYSDYGC